MVRVLATLLQPDSGSASVFGLDVVHQASQVREVIALTGQFAAIDELLTGRENLRMFGQLFRLSRQEAGRRADDLLERFDLADAGDRVAKTYSGGMRRRLDLASSLLTGPRMLFLDEPTTGLDPRSRNQIWESIRDLVARGTTLLLTTQYLEEADQLADRIAVIDHGGVIAEGTGDELKDSVGGQMIELGSPPPGTARGRSRLSPARVREPRARRGRARADVPAPQDGITIVEARRGALKEAGIEVADLGLRRPTLDDVFLTLTGAPARGRRRTEADEYATAERETPGLGADAQAPWLDLRDGYIVAGRNMRHFIRQPQLLLFSTIQPIMFVLLFAFVFGGAIAARCPRASATRTSCCRGSSSSRPRSGPHRRRSGSSEDMQRGVIDRFRSMPMARSAVLAGRTLADLRAQPVRGRADDRRRLRDRFPFREASRRPSRRHRGRRVRLRPQLDLRLRRRWCRKGPEAAQSAGFVAIFPLVFASSIFVPIDTMPRLASDIANVSPVTAAADAARVLAIGGAVGSSLWQVLAWDRGHLARVRPALRAQVPPPAVAAAKPLPPWFCEGCVSERPRHALDCRETSDPVNA